MSHPSAWPPLSPLSGRGEEIEALAGATAAARCSSLVGMSNIGKSFVLRALCRQTPRPPAPGPIYVYIDCNRMVASTDQGFYELVLRCLKAALPAVEGDQLVARLEQCYAKVVAPSTPFAARLSFSEAIAASCEGAGQPLALVLDEFDEAMESIDDHVLLNLRALRDTYPENLCYVTASRRRVESLRRGHGGDEFAELFGESTFFLAPLPGPAAGALAGQWAQQLGLALTPADLPLLVGETGGHPALLRAACHVLSRLQGEAQALGRPLSLAQTREQLDSDVACQAECGKFWQELDADERHALLQTEPQDPAAPTPAWQSLAERHLLRRGEGGLEPFCRLFATFIRRQRIARQPEIHGVRVDVEAGEVWTDGRPIPPLTDLEYRLLLLLYGHLDRIVDKYAVVEAVWGQAYIDEVDDARIEKLVSRLRQKIEADPAQPRYLQTVRGRGYRLVSP